MFNSTLVVGFECNIKSLILFVNLLSMQFFYQKTKFRNPSTTICVPFMIKTQISCTPPEVYVEVANRVENYLSTPQCNFCEMQQYMRRCTLAHGQTSARIQMENTLPPTVIFLLVLASSTVYSLLHFYVFFSWNNMPYSHIICQWHSRRRMRHGILEEK